jgi:hypothetical protein
MSADQLKEVVDFTVEREGIGSVRFLGTTGTLSNPTPTHFIRGYNSHISGKKQTNHK